MLYNFEKLEVWKLAMDLVDLIFKLSQKIPKEDKYTVRSQLIRAVISVPLNIAEGRGKRYRKEFAQHIRIAIGSLMEVIAILKILAKMVKLDENTQNDVENLTKSFILNCTAWIEA